MVAQLKILVLSSLYPPYFVGGYELGCRDVVEGLKRRGHAIKVLTSTYGIARPEDDGEVYRWLQSDLGWNFGATTSDRFRLVAKEIQNRRAFQRIVALFQPDLLYVWPVRYISLSLALLAQQRGLPVCYYVSDDWLARWEAIDRWLQEPRQPLRRAIKRLLGLAVDALGGAVRERTLDLRHVQFTSEHVKRAALAAGQPVGDASVIHWGVDLARFADRPRARDGGRRLLYVGQLARLKGVHTAIEALARLRAGGATQLELTIAGGTIFPHYEAELHALARSTGVERYVRFTGLLPREQLPALYREHDILLFPSQWEEPFSITLLEALASGLAVVGTSTGGSAEILCDRDNALTFAPGDAEACASQVRRLIDDQDLLARISRRGQQTVAEQFRIETMIERIDLALISAAGPAQR